MQAAWFLTAAFVAGASLMGATRDAVATVYEGEGVRVDIPDDFLGPLTDSPGPGAKMVGYTRPHDEVDFGTLLQITTYDFGSKMRNADEDEREELSDSYLTQMLQGVERARTDFEIVKRGSVTIDGIEAARAEWSGTAQGSHLVGVMYSLIVGTRMVNFHTQTLRDGPPDYMQAAVRAFESATFDAKP